MKRVTNVDMNVYRDGRVVAWITRKDQETNAMTISGYSSIRPTRWPRIYKWARRMQDIVAKEIGYAG